MQAMSEGTRSLQKDTEPTLDALLEADRGLDRKATEASLDATLPVFMPEDSEFPWGYMDTRKWERYGKWMLQNGLIDTEPTPTSLTNEYLPGAGV
jgi:hypothetical protein